MRIPPQYATRDFYSTTAADVIMELAEEGWPAEEVAATLGDCRDMIERLIEEEDEPLQSDGDFPAYLHRVLRDVTRLDLLRVGRSQPADPVGVSVMMFPTVMRNALVAALRNTRIDDDPLALAEDVLAETYLTVLKTIAHPSTRPIDNMRGYVMTAARRAARQAVATGERIVGGLDLDEMFPEAAAPAAHEGHVQRMLKRELSVWRRRKIAAQTRDARTRDSAAQRVLGFEVAKRMQFRRPDQPFTDHLRWAEEFARRWNSRCGRVVAVVPKMSTAFRWNEEVDERLKKRFGR